MEVRAKRVRPMWLVVAWCALVISTQIEESVSRVACRVLLMRKMRFNFRLCREQRLVNGIGSTYPNIHKCWRKLQCGASPVAEINQAIEHPKQSLSRCII